MKLPTIHLNGTGAASLTDENLRAMRALTRAMDALHDAQPNARDYYPQGDAAFSEARAEHQARIDKLESVRAEIETITTHCSNFIR